LVWEEYRPTKKRATRQEACPHDRFSADRNERRGHLVRFFKEHMTQLILPELSTMKVKTIRVIPGLTGGCTLALLIAMQSSASAAEAAAPAMPALAAAPAGQYQLDKSHASLLLRVSHLGFSTYTTRFSRFDAQLTFDPAKPATARVVTTIDAKSLELDDAPPQCNAIVQGPQFLDSAKFPKIVFRSQSVRMTGEKSMEISGTLDLHGVTRPIVLTGTFNGGYAGMPNMDPHARVGFSAHGSFKRSDFGMTAYVPAPGTTMGVGDLIDVSIEAEFTGPALAQAGGTAH
jgi:polyisoprenoid-binding protein YceI